MQKLKKQNNTKQNLKTKTWRREQVVCIAHLDFEQKLPFLNSAGKEEQSYTMSKFYQQAESKSTSMFWSCIALEYQAIIISVSGRL
jgi:hypothetical protein